MQVTFLGTGTSHGVPLIGCQCKTCTSKNKKNRRYRSAVLISTSKSSFLIDTPPELRLQLLENRVNKIDIICFTHPHADHIMGLDDVRGINRLQQKIIPCFANNYTINEIKKIFSYIFTAVQKGGGLPQISLNTISKPIQVDGYQLIPLPVKHGSLNIYGYRLGPLAYITDCSFIPERTFYLLEGIKVLILGALRFREHSTHMNLEQALKTIDRTGADRAYLTHIAHEMEHEEVNNLLPDKVRLAYDGLIINIKR